MLELLLVAGVVYLAYSSGAFAAFGVLPPAPSQTPLSPASFPKGLQSGVPVGGAGPVMSGTIRAGVSGGSGTTGANTTGLLVTGAATVGTAAAATPASFAAIGLSGAAAGAALAGVGVVAAIAVALWQAHEVRKKQATSENAAMNLGVQGYDEGLRQINQAFNSRQISASDAITLLNQVWQQFWQLVTPVIQPGRNGCSGGASCPPWPTGGNGCSGNIGAACCVGCYALAGDQGQAVQFPGQSSPLRFGIAGTIRTLQEGGGVVYYQEVYSSKYGGKDRPAYTLVWSQISAA